MKKHLFSILYTIFLLMLLTMSLLLTFVIQINKNNERIDNDNFKTGDVDYKQGVYTENSYKDENIEVEISTYNSYESNIYVCDIRINNVMLLKSAFAKDIYGKNIKEYTSTIAKRKKAIVAINGDYYGYRDKGYVIRNGSLYGESREAWAQYLAIDKTGDFISDYEYNTKPIALFNNNYWQVYSFGPLLVRDSKAIYTEKHKEVDFYGKNPRTAIGMIDKLHYVFIVCDGRSEASKGMTLTELSKFGESLNCKMLYNLDGGGSSSLYFNGKVINKPTSDGKSFSERGVSDIVYIGY